MNRLIIFKSSFVNGLRSSIMDNLNKYQRDEMWANEIAVPSKREMDTSVEINGNLILELPQGNNLMDIENSMRLHKALRHLSPLQARDPRLWTRLTHTECWEYMRKRWPVDKYLTQKAKSKRFIESRYFVTQSQSRALLRNGIARLWWTAQISCDSERENPYELTTVLLSTLDITQQILERGIGRAPNVVLAFLEFLLRYKDTLNRERIRQLAKFLNLHGGVCILDCLTKAEIITLLDNELLRILNRESLPNPTA